MVNERNRISQYHAKIEQLHIRHGKRSSDHRILPVHEKEWQKN